MPTDQSQPMTKDQREAAEQADAHEAAASEATPADPLAPLRAAIDRMKHQTTLDIHDRLHAHTQAIDTIADLILNPRPLGG